jgi:hypothetical protein
LKDVEWGSAMVGPYRVDKVSATYDEGPEYDWYPPFMRVLIGKLGKSVEGVLADGGEKMETGESIEEWVMKTIEEKGEL